MGAPQPASQDTTKIMLITLLRSTTAKHKIPFRLIPWRSRRAVLTYAHFESEPAWDMATMRHYTIALVVFEAIDTYPYFSRSWANEN
jgi:hypothetical protein